MAAAIAYQQTAVAETSAFFLAMLLAPKLLRRDAFVFLGTVVAITAGVAHRGDRHRRRRQGRLRARRLLRRLHAEGAPRERGRGRRAFRPGGCRDALIAAGAIASRRRERVDWVLVLWAGATLVVTAVAGQPYPHFLAPAVAPLTLLVVGFRMPSSSWFRAGSWRSLVGPGLQVAGLVIAIVMARVAGLDWVPIQPSATNSHTLSEYYGGAVAAVFDPTWRTTWLDDFDYRVAGDARVAAWITAHGLSGDPAVVWSYDAWVYALANLQVDMPTPPIYNDEVLLGYGGPVEQYVAGERPVLIVVDSRRAGALPGDREAARRRRVRRTSSRATRTPSGCEPIAPPSSRDDRLRRARGGNGVRIGRCSGR